MKFAKIVFTAAGIWGLVVLAPLYFTYDLIGRQYPPPVTHPDFYYGFLGVALAWQVGFLAIGREPERLRPMMIPAVLEKLFYVMSLVAVNAASLQLTPVVPSVLPDSTMVLRSDSLRKAYALTGTGQTVVPIPTDPIGTPGTPITLPHAAVALRSN